MYFIFSFDLLSRLNRRESSAIGWVFKKHYSYVFGVVHKITGNAVDSQDIVADVFEKLITSTERFESLAKVKYFLYTTAKNRCIDYLRHRQLSYTKLQDIHRYSKMLEENEFEKAESRALLLQQVHFAIEELPRRCRYIFLLYYTRGLDNSQIAAKLHVSEKTVANQKTIALRLLKLKITKIQGAAMTLFISVYQYPFHLQQIFRVIKSVLGSLVIFLGCRLTVLNH